MAGASYIEAGLRKDRAAWVPNQVEVAFPGSGDHFDERSSALSKPPASTPLLENSESQKSYPLDLPRW
jgi:hypothetical protein